MLLDTPADWITAADLRNHIKAAPSVDDAKLATFTGAACRMIVDRKGQVSPVSAVTEARVHDGRLVLEHRPVVVVTAVVALPGGAAVPQADPLAGVSGWSLESVEGVLAVSGWPGLLRVLYKAGRQPVPENFTLAALETAAHLWRTSQHNTGGGRPAITPDEQVVPGTTWALPYNVRQLLGLDRRPQDEVFVG